MSGEDITGARMSRAITEKNIFVRRSKSSRLTYHVALAEKLTSRFGFFF